MTERLLIVGASARAAAESAKRSNFDLLAVDQFCDQDLRDIADVRLCKKFPEQIPELADTLPAGGLILTGAMENHPSIVREISNKRVYWGCSSHAIAAVRDPIRLQDTLRQNDLPSVKTRLACDMGSADGVWLQKPLRSACGIGIRIQNAKRMRHTCAQSVDHYYQERIEGDSQSGVFVATDDSTVLMGVTEQWVGVPWLNARPFGYAGSLGPLRLDDNIMQVWQQIGDVLRQDFGLRGVFGVDAVLRRGSIYVIEVNPRFPASAEIVDLASDGQLMRHHVRACSSNKIDIKPYIPHDLTIAKAIYYAPQDLVVPTELKSIIDTIRHDLQGIRMADIPVAGTKIKQGNPVLTLLATGTSPTPVQQTLRASVDRLKQFLNCRIGQRIDSHAS